MPKQVLAEGNFDLILLGSSGDRLGHTQSSPEEGQGSPNIYAHAPIKPISHQIKAVPGEA